MFNSTEEFEAKLLHYLHSEEERLAVVRNAQRLAYARCATRPPRDVSSRLACAC